jgi:hypothetical protein
MAAVKSILVKSQLEAVVKAAGTGSITVDLDNDLIPMGGANPVKGELVAVAGSNSVTVTAGVCTSYWVGAQLFKSDGSLVGTVSSFVSATTVTLNSPVAQDYNGKFSAAFKTQALDGTQRKVNITGVMWSGAPSGLITVARGDTTIITLQADQPGGFTFDAQAMCVESTNNTDNITVTLANAQCEFWMKLRKAGGFKPVVESAQFSIYDDASTPDQ